MKNNTKRSVPPASAQAALPAAGAAAGRTQGPPGKPRRSQLAARNAALRQRFLAYYARGLRAERIYALLADEYFLSALTVERIVRGRG